MMAPKTPSTLTLSTSSAPVARALAGVALVALALGVSACDPKQAQQPAATSQGAGGAASASKKKQAPKEFSFIAASLAHEVSVGQQAEVALKVAPGSGFKINPDFPWSWSGASGSPKLTLAAASLDREGFKFTDAEAAAPLKVTAAEAGEHKVTGKISVSVCERGGKERCLWFNDQPVTLTIKAK